MKRTTDLTSHKYGKLSPLYRLDNNKWLCRCDCGNTVAVAAGSLRRSEGSTKSCGCYRIERTRNSRLRDIRNKRFGRLVVVKQLYQNKHNKYVWECLCDCGNTVHATTGSLISGNTKSCGCYARDRASEVNTVHGLSGTPEYQTMLHRKRAALNKCVQNIWSVSMEKCLRNTCKVCALCGMDNSTSLLMYGENLHIDHIMPISKGYGLTYDNVCLLCRSCNAVKGNKFICELPVQYAVKIVAQSVIFQLAWDKI